MSVQTELKKSDFLLNIRSPFSNQVKKIFMVYGHFLIYPKDLREE